MGIFRAFSDMIELAIKRLSESLLGRSSRVGVELYLSYVMSFFTWALISAAIVVTVLGFARHWPDVNDAFRFSSVCAMIFLAGAFAGGFTGFLFGVPRYRKPVYADGDKRQSIAGYTSNTNLEEISDWLTKIIVGVGLTQLEKMPHWLWEKSAQIADRLFAPGFTPQGAQSLTLILIIFSVIWGFLLAFTITKIYLPLAFTFVEDELQRREFDRLSSSVRDIRVTSDPLKGPAASTAQRENAEAIRENIDPSQLRTSDDLRVYAKALYVAEQYDRAREAYERAIRMAPGDYQLLREYAVVLGQLRQHARALDVLRDAKRLAHAKSDGFEDQIDETTMFMLLYVSGGYQEGIELAEALQGKNSPRLKQPQFWAWLAAAYGQKYAATASAASDEEKLDLRNKALVAVKKAIDLGPEWRSVLQGIWNPRLPGFTPNENDLVSFADDPEFRAVLG